MNLREIFGDRATQARRAAQKGFTLVEMAIVLVIIGLIIGGILKGQEIVNNGRVKTQVAQIDSVKAAVQTFVDKFGYFPGDDPLATTQLGFTSAFAGNGDGFVSQTPGQPDLDNATEAAAAGTGEPNMVWYELQAANLLSGVLSSTPSGVQTASNSYNYEGRIAGSFLTFADFSVATNTANTVNKMVRISGAANPATPTPPMREQDAAQIDLKYDDGLPNSGQIVAGEYSTINCCGGAACNASATTTYGLAAGADSAGAYCALFWATQ